MEWTWYCLILVLPAWFMRNVYHEGSHLLAGWLFEGRKPKGLYPYPHKKYGKFYFARCSFHDYLESYPPYRIRCIAPFIVDCILLVSMIPAFICSNPIARCWLLIPSIVAIVDAIWFWRGYWFGSDGCDGKRFRYGKKKTGKENS